MSGEAAHLPDAQHPWIGLSSFSEDGHAFFAGRSGEIDELLRLVRRDTLTLLFGVSGLGKTSLLQAGIFPKLRAEDWLPVTIRLDYLEGAPPLAVQVLATIKKAAFSAGVEAPEPRAGETLWEYFHREGSHFWGPRNDLVTPFLVFDQFEEAFTLGRETSGRTRLLSEFVSELADLGENRPPAALRDDPQRAREFSFEPVPLKILLAMREDYLADLDRIRSQFRALGQNRLRLLPMDTRQAQQVIELGAPLLAPGAAGRIVSFVGGSSASKDSAETVIAPALLSLVLRELNERRLERGTAAKITSDLLDIEQQKILEDFYLRTLQDFPAGVRNFIEDELLTATGFRNSCALDDALARSDVTLPILDELVDRRLLAYEDRHHLRRIEITHDVLTPVIKESRDTRLAREARAEAERLKIEAGEKQRVVQRVQTTVFALALLIASVFLLQQVFKGKRPDRGSPYLSAIYQELLKEPPASPDRGKIEEARQKLELLAKESKPDPKGFYGNAQLYADMAQLAEKLSEGGALSERDRLLASIYGTLDQTETKQEEALSNANSAFQRLSDNRQAAIARFVIDNYRRDQARRSIGLQIVSIIAVFVLLPIWTVRRFLGREPIMKRLWRRARSEAIQKPPNPFVRLFADIVDIVAASLLGSLVARAFIALSGIAGLWVNREISDTAWGINHVVGILAFMGGTGAYLLFCDAIKFTHRRSIGKIMCRIIPVIMSPDRGAVTIRVSAKRHSAWVLACVLMLSVAFLPSADDPTPQFLNSWIRPIAVSSKAGGLAVRHSAAGRVLAWLGKGRANGDGQTLRNQSHP
jgi:hypothetical protein